MANKLFQAFIDTAKTIAGYPITVANAVFMRDGSTLDEFSETIPHREDDENTNIEVPNIDADMLNGHPADYYAKQSDLSALNTSVTQVNNKIGNTDVSKWGNSLTGAIKAACDKADANEAAIADVNSNLVWKFHHNYNGSETAQLPEDYTEIYLLFGMDSDTTRLPMIIPRIALSPTVQTQYKTSTVSVESESLGICFAVTQKNASLAWVFKNYIAQDRSMYWFDIYYR